MKKLRILIVLSFIISCLMILACCGTKKVDTPTNFKVDEATLSLSWDSVKDSRGYKILVNKEEYVSKAPSYPLDPLVPGEYVIEVQAISDNEELEDSDWATFEYTREVESGLSYSLINNNTEYEVKGLGSASGDVVIDDYYRGKPVTKIGDMAFANKSKEVRSVTLGKYIRSIGSRAFYNCSLMEGINFGEAPVTEIGAYAFQYCRTLTSVTLPKNLKEVSNSAFAYCRSLETIVLPDGLTSIGLSAFANCDKLDNVVIPDEVTSIGEYAFAENVSMKTVTIGNGVEVVPKYAFLNCSALTSISFGSGVKTIDEYAFSGCVTLPAIALPNSVETIGKGAFINCALLASIDLSDNLTSIGAGAFENTFAWLVLPGILSVDGWIIGYNANLGVPTEVTIPEGTIGIADRAFYKVDEKWTTSGWAIIFPSSVRYIGSYSFYQCEKLSAVEFGSGLKTVGAYAFAYCKYLNTVSAKEGLEVIDNYAFQACESLAKSGVFTVVDGQVMEAFPSTLKRIGTYAFEGTMAWNNSIALVIIGDWVVGVSESAAGSMESVHIDQQASGIRGIADYAFYGAMALNTVTIPETVKYIGRCAFYGCASLVNVTLPMSLEVIEEFTFYQCSFLSSIYIPQSVKRIGYSAFNKCYALQEVTIPAAVEEIDDFAFYKCNGITSLTFETENGESSLKSIGNRVFYQCTALTEVVLPNSLTEMGTHVFYKCIALNSVVLGDGLKEISDYTFYGCEALASVTMSDSIERIGSYAFRDCAAMTSIRLSNSLKDIGRYAFYGCAGLETVKLPDSVTTIHDYAFRNCNGLKGVILSDNITSMGKHVFNGSNNATFYVEYESKPMDWLGQWNSSRRTIVWGCTLSEDNSYVVSFVKTATSITYPVATNGMAAPTRDGFTFGGWTTTEGSTTADYTMENVKDAPNGTTLYAIWNQN